MVRALARVQIGCVESVSREKLGRYADKPGVPSVSISTNTPEAGERPVCHRFCFRRNAIARRGAEAPANRLSCGKVIVGANRLQRAWTATTSKGRCSVLM